MVADGRPAECHANRPMRGYAEYLRLDVVLGQQRPLSGDLSEMVHDELLSSAGATESIAVTEALKIASRRQYDDRNVVLKCDAVGIVPSD